MNKYWMVGKLIDYKKEGDTWELCGLYDSEEKAVKECTTEDHFIGPLVLNEKIDIGVAEHWPGGYYPLDNFRYCGVKERFMEAMLADEGSQTKAWTGKDDTIRSMNGVSDEDGE